MNNVQLQVLICFCVYRISPGGGGGEYAPLLFFFHHPKRDQGIKLTLPDFKDSQVRHFSASKTSSLHFELLPWQQNYKWYLAEFGSKEKWKISHLLDIELKIGI